MTTTTTEKILHVQFWPVRELSDAERSVWGVCPKCGSKHGINCADSLPLYAHADRILAAPRRVHEVPCDETCGKVVSSIYACKKPPLGVPPKWMAELLYRGERLKSLQEAIVRGIQADQPIPKAWDDERMELIARRDSGA